MHNYRKHDLFSLGFITLLLLLLLIVQACSKQGVPIEFEFHEGTDMEVSPSPDGRYLALQLWSQIWILDMSNGSAFLLMDTITNPDEQRSPCWSPDGEFIVFSSLRSDGGLFVISISGGKPRQITFDESDSQPSWSPDGRTIVFWRAGSGGLWTVPVQGGSAKKIESEADDALFPAWSPDGKWIACSWQGGIAVIAPDGSSVRQITKGPGDLAPSWSPDGQQVFFLSAKTGEVQIWSVPMGGGEPMRLTDERELSGYAPKWIPGKDLLLYVAGGKIRTLNTISGARGSIPFSARISMTRKNYNQISPEIPAPGQRMPVRGLSSPVPSPDGELIAFSALGDLWVRHTSGKTEQLTSGPEDDADPAWSHDGSQLAYVSSRSGDYQVWALDISSRMKRPVTTTADNATTPIWQPSGENIIFVESTWVQQTLCIVPATGGNPRTIVPAGADRITPLGWFPEDQSLVIEQLVKDSKTGVWKSMIKRVRLDGSPVSWTFDLPDQVEFAALSNRGETLAYVLNGELWIQDLTSDLGSDKPLIPGPAFFPAWSPDRSLLYVNSGKLWRVDTNTREQRTLPVRLSYEIPRVRESVLLHNARLLTPEPLEGLWDVLLRDGRIRSLHPAGTQPGSADRIMDLEGKTVIPGLINLHEHLDRGHPLEGFLYWGNTSVASAGDEGHWSVSQQEAIYSGRRQGPRLFPSGGFVVPSHVKALPERLRVKTQEQLVRYIEHLDGLGATQIKFSPFDRREPWVEAQCIETAHRHGLPVLSHYLRPASVAAGLDRKEHAFNFTPNEGLYFRASAPVFSPFEQDTIEIMRKAEISLCSAIVVFFITSSEGRQRFKAALAQPDIAGFLLPSHAEFLRVSTRGASSTTRLMDKLMQVCLANLAAAHRAGVRIIAGTDIFFLPTGIHWDLELLVRAGLSPLEALRAATNNAASELGLEGRLGCISPGAVADLVVLEADPLEDIRNTQKIYAVFQGGRIVDRTSLLKAAK